MLLKIIVLLMVILTGCSSNPKIQPVSYSVPELNLPIDPVNYTAKLTSKSTPDEVMKAWVSTAVACRGWNLAVRQQVRDSD